MKKYFFRFGLAAIIMLSIASFAYLQYEQSFNSFLEFSTNSFATENLDDMENFDAKIPITQIVIDFFNFLRDF